MYFWTSQEDIVLKKLLADDVYYPDFSLSNGLGSCEMKNAYNNILSIYNEKNKMQSNGLVFGITKLDDIPVKDIKQYRNYFILNSTFWDDVSGAGTNYTILKLNISDDIDTIPIYFQDFIVLGMRSIHDKSFSIYVKEKLQKSDFCEFAYDLNVAQKEGWTDESLLNKITQAHIHEIKISDIVEIYQSYDFSNKKEYPLGKYATLLKEKIINN